MKKKVLSILIALFLLCAALPLGVVSAAVEEYVEGPLTFVVYNGEVSIRDCDESVTRVEIPATVAGCPVTEIPGGLFADCTELVEVIIPDSVTIIGDNAFADCVSLRTITIPDSVTEIAYQAFYRCESLTSVTLGAGVATINNVAFHGCNSLTTIHVAEENPYFSFEDSVLFNKDKTTLVKYFDNQATEYVIPEGVTTIAESAFSYCKSLTSVCFPDGVVAIESGAFSDCTSLASVTLAKSVTTIGDRVFSCCNALTDVYYEGDETDRKAISINPFNNAFTDANWHYSVALVQPDANDDTATDGTVLDKNDASTDKGDSDKDALESGAGLWVILGAVGAIVAGVALFLILRKKKN